ncbi:hypothetical protein B1199_16995 [Pseudoalteromonas ulvae]|uniref:Insertion element IS402-like domain-containing protein n=1 Tax=Pseudoalteromonas ulvae TaxID=107327 RepID=A0A244CL76_PSEDV|nr:hypothetical protein B1199_16995 [Pseudoalteromonas ulvae]
MPRTMLTDNQWLKLKELLVNSGRVYNKLDHIMTFEGILYRMRTGVPWRDSPPAFGHWSTVFRRFNLWSKKGILNTIFKCLAFITDSEQLMGSNPEGSPQFYPSYKHSRQSLFNCLSAPKNVFSFIL